MPRTAPQSDTPQGWRRYRQEIRFLVVFLLVLTGTFTLLSLNSVNDHVIEPFTASIARASGVSLDLLGQDITRTGTVLRSPRFAVNIRNGCNGVEAMVIFLAAILAFPAAWAARLIGLVLGVLVIQLVNLLRVVALFLTGAYLPSWFDSSHTVVWQTVVILAAVLLWLFWANRFATPRVRAEAG
ncbi:MAG TPA: exosortase H [Thermoanaerobaculia bacterium]|nr:exosortase H [Thermoanaerobaculia bacterium]